MQRKEVLGDALSYWRMKQWHLFVLIASYMK